MIMIIYDDESVTDVDFREVDDRYNEQGSPDNTTFTSSIIGVFLLFGGVTYFLSDSGNSAFN